jgi:cytochrome c peroxidase
VQAALRHLLIGEGRSEPDTVLLPRTIASFKTPGLRALVFSDPYLHNGSKDTLEEVIDFTVTSRALPGRAKSVMRRRSFPASFEGGDVALLVAFLRSLNEDYE